MAALTTKVVAEPTTSPEQPLCRLHIKEFVSWLGVPAPGPGKDGERSADWGHIDMIWRSWDAHGEENTDPSPMKLLDHPIAQQMWWIPKTRYGGTPFEVDFGWDQRGLLLGDGGYKYENNEWMDWLIMIWDYESDNKFWSNRGKFPLFCRNHVGTGFGFNVTNVGDLFNATSITMKDMPTNLTGIDLSGLPKHVLSPVDAMSKMREGWAIVNGKWSCGEYPKCDVGDWTSGNPKDHPRRDMDCYWYCDWECDKPSLKDRPACGHSLDCLYEFQDDGECDDW